MSGTAVETLIIGAGVTGLATAAALGDAPCLILEGDREIGGFCKTVRRDGFVWDYSGHFFHFKHPAIEAWLRARMGDQRVRVVDKRSFIWTRGTTIDFPFQKNIHQLPREDFLACLVDLYLARAPRELLGAHAPPAAAGPETSFLDMLVRRFGRGIAERFLIPYNEKLYACDLATLDVDAMGRFFPHADLTDIIVNMRRADNASYNASFTYPEGGAIEYVKAIASAVDPARISLGEPLVGLDLARKVARTPTREITYQRLVSSAPLPKLLTLAGVPHDAHAFSWNKVLVFNLGFDRKGPPDSHWTYFPDKDVSFYRVGFYDNIFDADRMSLYVELGLPHAAPVDVAAMRARVLADLEKVGIVRGHALVAEHSVVMDPAYVHIRPDGLAEAARCRALLEAAGVASIGRYGGWTYCAIEDNILEARALVKSWTGKTGALPAA